MLACWVIDLVKPSGQNGKRPHIKTVTSPESEGLSIDEPLHVPASLHKRNAIRYNGCYRFIMTEINVRAVSVSRNVVRALILAIKGHPAQIRP